MGGSLRKSLPPPPSLEQDFFGRLFCLITADASSSAQRGMNLLNALQYNDRSSQAMPESETPSPPPPPAHLPLPLACLQQLTCRLNLQSKRYMVPIVYWLGRRVAAATTVQIRLLVGTHPSIAEPGMLTALQVASEMPVACDVIYQTS